MRSILISVIAITVLLGPLSAGKKKKREEVTQTLEAPPDPPAALTTETRRLVFHVSPLSGKGLLSIQTREAVRALLKENGGLPVVKLRAFVAGTGDLRRVPLIVSEILAEKKHLQLPVVTVVQVGGLPLEGAQMILESASVAKRDVNPLGLVFIPAQERSSDKPLEPLAPLIEDSLNAVRSDLQDRGEALRVTCFVTTLDDAPHLSALMRQSFPSAALNLVQTQRAPARSSASCEAVGRAVAPSSPRKDFAWINTDRLVFTGTQIAYGFTDEDARVAFRRMDRVLAGLGSSTKSAALLQLYPLSPSISAQASRLRKEFVDASHPPATTIVTFEGLPGMDASFGLEVVAPSSAAPSRTE